MSIASDMYKVSGAKPMKFPTIGTTIEGAIASVRVKQREEFGRPGVLETWPNGDPKMTPIWTIQTTLCEDVDDDGARDVYMQGGVYTACGAALRTAYSAEPSDQDLIGARFRMRFSRTIPTNKGTPRKIYECIITPRQTHEATSPWSEGPVGEYDGPPDGPSY